MVKQAFKYVAAFLAVLCILFAFTVSVCIIPDKKVYDHFLESAQFMEKHDVAHYALDFALSSKIDYYADCNTLSIAYYLGHGQPLEAAMWCSYYGENSTIMNDYLMESVSGDVAADHEYLRYWHGSAVLMRIAHLVTNVQTIYIAHAVILVLLIVLLSFILIKHGYRSEAISFLLAMILISIWFVPMCLEYYYTFMCMVVASIVGILLSFRSHRAWHGLFFLIVGMITVYLDFLTTETLTLLIPLLFIVRIYQNESKSSREVWKTVLKSCFAWMIGYMGMWVMKWGLATIILGENVMPYVTGHVAQRLYGQFKGYEMTASARLDLVLKNILRLFPLEYGLSGAILILVFVAAAFVFPVATGRVVLRKKIDGKKIGIYAVLGLIPYVRYLVLANHSFIHYFFTYRAQAATILAICFILFELVEVIPKRKDVVKNV